MAAASAVGALLGIGAAAALAASPPPPPPPTSGGGGSPPPASTSSPPATTPKQPPADTQPPGRVRHLRAITTKPGQITLVWTDPKAKDLAGIVVRRGWAACPASPSDGVPVGGKSVRTRQIDTGAVDGTSYCYGVFAFDASHNHSAVALDPDVVNSGVVAAPKPVTDLTATPLGTKIVLSWRNPANSDLAFIAVRRGVGTDCPTGPADGTPVGGETVRNSQTDATATPGVTYCYRVYALDSNGAASPTKSDASGATKKHAAPAPSHPTAAPSSGGGWMTSTLTHAVATIVLVVLLVMALAMAVTRRRTHTSAYATPRDLGPRLAISGYAPVALVIPALLILGSCAAIVLVLINL